MCHVAELDIILGVKQSISRLGHLRRTYFDSCDIAIDCLLKTLCGINRKCLGYAETVRKVAPDYPVWLERMRSASIGRP